MLSVGPGLLATLAGLATGASLEIHTTGTPDLTGGKSAQLWFAGRVRNRPSQGEQTVANSLLVIRKP